VNGIGGLMIRLIYSSSLTKDQTPAQIEQYLGDCREYNRAHKLCGLIVRIDRNLLSVREGPEEMLRLYIDWLQDQPACHSLIVLASHQIQEPMFRALRLAYIEARLGMDLEHPKSDLLAQVLSMSAKDADQDYTLRAIKEFLHGKWHHRAPAHNQAKFMRR